MIRFRVDGEPMGKERARSGSGKNHYTPERTRLYEMAVRVEAMKAMGAREPLAGPVSLAMKAVMPIPKSFSRKKREAALRGEIRPTGKPDLSNIIKAVEDAMNEVVYRDDGQIAEYGRSGKIYGDHPMIIVDVVPL